MKKLVAQGIGLLGIMSGGVAMAADMPAPFYKAPPLVATDIWNGFYGGVNAGAGLARNRTNDTTVLPGLTPFPVFDTATFSHAPHGGVFGLQAGWNWHVAPSWVIGVEADWQWTNSSESACTYGCLPASGTPALLSITDEQSIKWFGTARGRLGWLTPGGSLLYVTGGGAWGRIDQNLTLAGAPGGAPFFAAGDVSAANFGQTKFGWTLGAGIETPFANHWSLKAEYLFVDLGTINNSFGSALSAAAILNFPAATTQVTTSSSTIRDQIVRVGVNYHFGGGDAPYAGAYNAVASPDRAGRWNGFYGGVNGGAALARNSTTDTTVVFPGATFPVFGNDTFSHAPVGGLFGGQVGFNWVASTSWLLGAEADWQWSRQTDSACISQCLPAGTAGVPGTPGPPFGTFLGTTNEQSLRGFGTARGRLGWIAPNGSLWYATGGAAWGRVEDNITLFATPAFFATGTTSSASFSHDRLGWTIGAGTEIPLWDRWSMKAEYLYIDLGRITDSFTSALDAVNQAPLTGQTTTTSYTVHDHIFRFGVNYHFN